MIPAFAFGTLKLNMYERNWFNIYGFYYGD